MKPQSHANILLVTFQRHKTTKRCIESVLKNTGVPTKLYIVDNGSDAPLRRYLLGCPGTKIFLEKNIGFYKALNLAMRIIPDELVAILDCDIVVSPGWWRSLSGEVTRNKRIGLAGSRYLNADGSLQEGFPVLRKDGWYGNNVNDYRKPADCQYIAIGCSVLRRSAWQSVDGFDENYFINHGDIDFCYKLRYNGGYHVRYCPKSSVVHDRDYGREKSYDRLRFDSDVCLRDHTLFKMKWQRRYEKENPFAPS